MHNGACMLEGSQLQATTNCSAAAPSGFEAVCIIERGAAAPRDPAACVRDMRSLPDLCDISIFIARRSNTTKFSS
eukprot:3374211-Pleurochrysis_carterae.AAC.3